jgi:hypothetical protein
MSKNENYKPRDYIKPEKAFLDEVKNEARSISRINNAIDILSGEGVETNELHKEVGHRIVRLGEHLARYGDARIQASHKGIYSIGQGLSEHRNAKFNELYQKMRKKYVSDDQSDVQDIM